jgi:adenylate kinase family enzyme
MQRFERENGELLDYYKKLNKVREVDGNGTVEQVYKNIGHQLAPQIIFFFG